MATKKNYNVNINRAKNGFVVDESWQEEVPGGEYPDDPRLSHDEYRAEQYVFISPGAVVDFVCSSLAEVD